MMKYIAFLAAALLEAAPASAQLVEANQIGVRMGHVHLAVTDVEAHKRFWIGLMGGTLVRNGPLELIQFPGAYIMLRKVDAPAPPNTTAIVNHFGFTVKDMPASLARWKAAGVKIEPLPENPNEVYLYAPDDVKVEVYGEPALSTPISMNHIHYYASDIPAIKRWYVNAFGANPGQRPCIACISKPRMIEADDLPGVNLTFAAATAPVIDGTRGHSLDHIGFDVINLEAMVKSLEARGIKIDEPIREVPGSTVRVAFLSDPWGTYIELTEDLTP